jgi:hypothetical protein
MKYSIPSFFPYPFGIEYVLGFTCEDFGVSRRRRRWFAAGIGVLLLATLGFVSFVCLTTPPPGVTLENFRRLREGMSKQEVASILGAPEKELYSRNTQIWEAETLTVFLRFESEGALSEGLAMEDQAYGLTKDEGILDRIRRMLRW